MNTDEKIAKIRSMLKEVKDKGTGDDLVEMFEKMIDEPERLLQIQDEFHFDNAICTTKCNGSCCSGDKIIRLTPIDVDHLVKGMPFLSRETILNNVDMFVGSESMMPLATIRFVQLRKGLSICPFCAVRVDARDRAKMKVNGICLAGQKNKPPACFWFPLGRAAAFDKDDGRPKDEDSLFFIQSCPATKTDKKISIRAFVDQYKERANDIGTYVMKMERLIERAKKKLPDQAIRLMMIPALKILFYSDRSFDEKFAEVDAIFSQFGI